MVQAQEVEDIMVMNVKDHHQDIQATMIAIGTDAEVYHHHAAEEATEMTDLMTGGTAVIVMEAEPDSTEDLTEKADMTGTDSGTVADSEVFTCYDFV